MAKPKTDVDPKTVAKQDAKQKDKNSKKIREGQSNNSMLSDKERPKKNAYPRKHTAQKQYDNEPEFKSRDNDDTKQGSV